MSRRDKIRVLMAKPGVDGHWRGIITVSKALRDAGMEVIYLGNQTPEQIARVAAQEDVDVVGLSVLAAGHLRLITETVNSLKDQKVEDVLLVVGGIIPQIDIPDLKKEGVDEIFLPGTPLDTIVEYIRTNAPERSVAD
ncbi:MAG: cobalamin B12-binding domain-containing protein [Deltaproteobacteria bacterium]|nr:cobalamin B12-binding domain-containing protein [Deltaproteobacteria bacterium]MBW2183620.1 cobalamin B12-binding domain-containing protein [Deltaproteobacteria bacterium]